MNSSLPKDGMILVVNFNQSHEIKNFLNDLKTHFPLDQCLVVDDGSDDGSPVIAEQAGFKVICHETNLGIGATIRTGLQHALVSGYRWVLITASNGKMLPSEFSRVYGPIVEGTADYVQGNRFHPGGASPGLPLFRRMMIPLFGFFVSLLLGRHFKDITCGLRCYTLDILKSADINLDQQWLDRYELEYYLHFKVVRAKQVRILEVPITMRYDQLAPGRKSKIKPIVGWWSMIRPFLLLTFRLRK